MKKNLDLFAFFFMAAFLVPFSASAATIFDSTQGADKGSDVPLSWYRNIDCGQPGDPQPHYLTFTFAYTSDAQIGIDQIAMRTYSGSGSHVMCLHWINEAGSYGDGCGTVPATSGGVQATTTISFLFQPFAFPLGTPITFYTSATVPFDTSIDWLGYSEVGHTEISSMAQLCDGHGYSELAKTTYGVPGMKITGSAVIAAPPDYHGFGLDVTTTAVTQDFGLFGNFFRDVLIWLFQPPPTVTEQYQLAVIDLQTKVPWGWWTQVSSGFAAVSSTQSATTTALYFSVPHNGVTTTVSVFDIHAATSLIPSSLLALIRTIGGVAMWALFGTWIWVIVTGGSPTNDDV